MLLEYLLKTTYIAHDHMYSVCTKYVYVAIHVQVITFIVNSLIAFLQLDWITSQCETTLKALEDTIGDLRRINDSD